MPAWRAPLAVLLSMPLAFASVAALAQDWRGVGRMEGRVTDPDGKPLPDVVVRLELPARGGTTLKTDKRGKWAIGGIAAGIWHLDFETPGFLPKKISARLPSESARLPPIEVRLAKAGPFAGVPPVVVEAIQKGDEAYQAGRYPEARAQYEKLLALRPDLATTLHTQIARCYSQEGDYTKELEHLQKVLDAEPGNPALRALMAQEALKGGMLERGMELLARVDESTIKDPDVFFNVAVLLLNQQQTEAALPYLSKAIALDPTYVDGYFQRALAYLQLQRLAESKADFRSVLELSPDGPQAETARKALEQLK